MKLVIIAVDDAEIPVFVREDDVKFFDHVVPEELARSYFDQNPEMEKKTKELMDEFLKSFGLVVQNTVH
jgi:hypothetical protein